MDLLLLAMALSREANRRELGSALPDAPVVPDRTARPRRPRAARSRTTLARLLESAAHRIAPRPSCPPLH